MKVQPGTRTSAAALFASFVVIFAPALPAWAQEEGASKTVVIESTDDEQAEAAAKAAHEADEAAARAAHEAAEAAERAEQQAVNEARNYPEARRTPITVVGCVIREREWRKQNGGGNGGQLRTGLGLGNEYILIHASQITDANPEPAVKSCDRDAGGAVFELTGGGEGRAKPFLGQRVVVTGMLKRARITRASVGTNHPQPTGGRDFLWGQDLRLFEINVATVSPYVPQVAAAPTILIIPRAAAAPPAAAPETPHAEPEVAGTAGREVLPKTASEMPLVALFGAFFFIAAIALRVLRGITSSVDM